MAEVDLNNKFKGNNKKFIKNMVDSASPAQLVVLLYEGAMQWIHMAKVELDKNTEAKLPNWTNYCHYLDMAAKIMTHLQETLNHEPAPEIAENLFDLYDFIKNNLITANAKKDKKLLDDAVSILKEIRNSWKECVNFAKV